MGPQFLLAAKAIGAIVGAGAAVKTAVDTSKQRKETKQAFAKQEADTAAQLEATRKSEAEATAAAAKKTEERKLAIETGGRPSTFVAEAFGLRTPANIRKKTLG